MRYVYIDAGQDAAPSALAEETWIPLDPEGEAPAAIAGTGAEVPWVFVEWQSAAPDLVEPLQIEGE